MKSEFDDKAREWDNNKIHIDRSIVIASEIKKELPAESKLKALEYGAGTGLLSFELKDSFKEIVLMDNSREMIKVCEEKKEYYKTSHVRPILFDLEHHDFNEKFDIIYTQMVLHHVVDTDQIFMKFEKMLNPNGILAIADLYLEDGSFHGQEVKVHHGFDPEKLKNTLLQKGFKTGKHHQCFVITRPNGEEYPIFLLIAKK